ncbi:MAG: hypothetical protein KC444_10205 [Nitrosopumilus sp.]|nr:hypothetical protein [Nitrosopumilus sp.]
MGNENGCDDIDGSGPLSLGDLQFNDPRDVAIDKDKRIYLVDGFNHRIQVFTIDTTIKTCDEGTMLKDGICVNPNNPNGLTNTVDLNSIIIAVITALGVIIAAYLANRTRKEKLSRD